MYIVRKPESIRSPALQRSANTTSGGTRNLFGLSAQAHRQLARVGVGPGRQQDREDGRSGEHDERVAQRPLRPERGSQGGQRCGDRGPDDPGERDPAVGLDQGESLRQEPRDGGGPGNAVRLGGDEDTQRRREHRDRLRGHGVGHQPAQERPQRHRGADRPPSTVAEPVQERPDQRRDDGEGQHRQAEEQGDLAARLAGLGEEQRAGQGDGHGGVTGGVERVQLDQPVEPGVAGALGAGGAARLAEGVRRSRAGRLAGPPDARAPSHRPRAGPARVPDPVPVRCRPRCAAAPPCPHPANRVAEQTRPMPMGDNRRRDDHS